MWSIFCSHAPLFVGTEPDKYYRLGVADRLNIVRTLPSPCCLALGSTGCFVRDRVEDRIEAGDRAEKIRRPQNLVVHRNIWVLQTVNMGENWLRKRLISLIM
jgi:hypothetical protein